MMLNTKHAPLVIMCREPERQNSKAQRPSYSRHGLASHFAPTAITYQKIEAMLEFLEAVNKFIWRWWLCTESKNTLW